MTEKKTFKGVELGTYYPSPDIPWEWIASGQHFKHTEWDMEITFTKKFRPLEIGQRVEVYPKDSEYPFQGEVLWFDGKYALLDKGYGAPELVSRDIIGL